MHSCELEKNHASLFCQEMTFTVYKLWSPIDGRNGMIYNLNVSENVR